MSKDKPGKQPSNDLTGVVETPQPPSTKEAGPPIDDQVCMAKPPAIGNWHVSAVNGVIQGLPNPWVQD